MGLRKKQASSGMLDFGIDSQPLEECLTAHGGLPLVAETFRALGGRAAVERHLKLKARERGISEGDMVEDFLLLLASGGECFDDFAVLAEDQGLAATLGRTLAGPDAARKFLYRFHDEDMQAKRPQHVLAWVPEETTALQGLAKVNATLVQEFQRRQPEVPGFTVDMDASLIASHNIEAKAHYDGGRGYQPEFAIWAETLMVLADEFRDGNVPAAMDPLSVVKAAFGVLAPEVLAKLTMAFRGDSACYNHELLNWLRNPAREGPQGKIRFAISACMSPQLRAVIEKVPAKAWQPYRRPDGQASAAEVDELRSWADVVFVPSDGPSDKTLAPDRYIAIRIQKRQGELFADGTSVKHFAIVTNDWDADGGKVLWWQRQKAGTVEQVHDMIQNGLGLGTVPCQRFGANAAWTRLNVLTHNVLQALKWIALPPEERHAHPKRMRFRVFALAGRVTHSARRTWLRLAGTAAQIARQIAVRAKLWMAPPSQPVLVT